MSVDLIWRLTRINFLSSSAISLVSDAALDAELVDPRFSSISFIERDSAVGNGGKEGGRLERRFWSCGRLVGGERAEDGNSVVVVGEVAVGEAVGEPVGETGMVVLPSCAWEAREARWHCRASCWVCRRRYFWRVKERSGWWGDAVSGIFACVSFGFSDDSEVYK